MLILIQKKSLLINEHSGYTRSGQKIVIDPVAFTKKFPILRSQYLRLMHVDFIQDPIFCNIKAALKKNKILLSNQDQDYYWTNAWRHI